MEWQTELVVPIFLRGETKGCACNIWASHCQKSGSSQMSKPQFKERYCVFHSSPETVDQLLALANPPRLYLISYCVCDTHGKNLKEQPVCSVSGMGTLEFPFADDMVLLPMTSLAHDI